MDHYRIISAEVGVQARGSLKAVQQQTSKNKRAIETGRRRKEEAITQSTAH